MLISFGRNYILAHTFDSFAPSERVCFRKAPSHPVTLSRCRVLHEGQPGKTAFPGTVPKNWPVGPEAGLNEAAIFGLLLYYSPMPC
jgi:hypothetical protein